MIHIPFLKTQGSSGAVMVNRCCSCSKGRKEKQGHGLESWTGVWRMEEGLRRVRLALAADDFFSLRMRRCTQGWSGGAQSW